MDKLLIPGDKLLEILLKRKGFRREDAFKINFPITHKFITNNYFSIESWKEKIYLYTHKLQDPPTCPMCGKSLKFINFVEGYSLHCSIKCSANDPETRKKFQQTCIDHWGVPNASQSKEVRNKIVSVCEERYGGVCSLCSSAVREKSKQTNIKRYGVPNAAQNEKVREKIKITNKKRYGVECALQNKEIREKALLTNKKRYGDSNPMKTKAVQDKLKRTCEKKFGGPSPFCSKKVRQKSKETYRSKTGYSSAFENPKIKDKIKETMIRKYGVDNMFKLPKFNEMYPNMHNGKGSSKLEVSYQTFLESTGYTIIKNDREILRGKEIDIYLKEYNLGIEINGCYYHSNEYDPSNKFKHRQKRAMCFNNGIELISIWEDWNFNTCCQFIIDKINGECLLKYKKLWFPDLNNYEWPLDLGLPQETYTKYKVSAHCCKHNGYECWDSGVISILE